MTAWPRVRGVEAIDPADELRRAAAAIEMTACPDKIDTPCAIATARSTAELVAALLQEAARAHESYSGLPGTVMLSPDVPPAYGHTYMFVQLALGLAEAVLAVQGTISSHD